MPRANLKGQAEVVFLRQAVREVFESQANRVLIANTNKNNYISLAEEISRIAQDRAQGTPLQDWNLTVSEGQVRSLFIESNKDFLDYFVQACYLYTQGISREAFLAQADKQDTIKSWEQDSPIAPLSNDTELQQKSHELLESQVKKLKKRLKQGLFFMLLGLIGVWVLFFSFQSKQEKTIEQLRIWSGSKAHIEKDELLAQLDFLKPHSGFSNTVDTIIRSLQTPSVFFNPEATLPIVPYKNIVRVGGYQKYHNTFYPDQISIIPFHGFSGNQLDSAKVKIQGMASYLHQLYNQSTHRNGETHISKDFLAKIMGLEQTDFDVDLIYLGYKQDVDKADSDDFMLRYPPYKMDESDLQNYVMVARQWWHEAVNKTGIHWQQSFNNQNLYCGISKSYPTVRVHAPNQRTFWVDIPIPNASEKTKMVLAIDLILKD
ncbi:MAG: hypothetical protein JNL70_25370 [Saprospiraceae bacterium]|nr:hypothetical protein [Saprospiraceae bacterium]